MIMVVIWMNRFLLLEKGKWFGWRRKGWERRNWGRGYMIGCGEGLCGLAVECVCRMD